MNQPKVSIIIVTRNGLEDLQVCLPSIQKQTFQDFELCIVDNGSTDGSHDYVRSLHEDKFSIISLDTNHGFALPNNIGYKNTSGTYVLTLNNDIELDPYFLERAVLFLDSSDNSLYAINPKMIYYYERDKINTIGIGLLRNGNGYNVGKGEPIGDYSHNKDIFGPCGGAAFYKRIVIEELGGYLFDNSYFAYLEDLDLAIRANLQGYSAKYLANVVCYHKHSNTSKRFPWKKLYLIERNRIRNLIKYYSWKNILQSSYYTVSTLLKAKKAGKIDSKQKELLSITNLFRVFFILIKARIVVFYEFVFFLKNIRNSNIKNDIPMLDL